jgi:hypothetical protein
MSEVLDFIIRYYVLSFAPGGLTEQIRIRFQYIEGIVPKGRTGRLADLQV